jgi:DNA primase
LFIAKLDTFSIAYPEESMARIPEGEIERLKNEISIQRLVEAHGVVLKRQGSDLHGQCPLHKDQGPSLVVSPAKNLWHCLGACNTGGSVIDWVMKTQGVSFRHAVELLRADVKLEAPPRPVKNATVPKLPSAVDVNAGDQSLLIQVVNFYHQALKTSPEALAYLKSRGITSPDVIERYQLGFANRTLGLRLPDKNRKVGGTIRERLQNLGILRASGHEHFNGSVIVPVTGENGDILEIYGRKITPNLRPGTPDHLYLKGPHRGVFNIRALARYDEVILCEALIDALTFLEAGFPNVTASYGAGGFTPDHWEAFRRFKTKRVLIAYDRDDAGENGALSLAAELMAAGIECYRIQFPRGMDANEYALKVLPAAKSLGLVIRKAVWLGKGAAPARDSGGTVDAHGVETVTPLPEPAAAPTSPAGLETKENHIDENTVPATSQSVHASTRAEQTATALSQSAPPAASLAPAPPTPSAEPPASPQPPRSIPLPPVERDGPDVRITLGDRRYRIRGLEKNIDVTQLKVNLLVTCGDLFHVDEINLYMAPKRLAFSRLAALELGLPEELIKKDLGRILCALEQLQEEQRRAAITPKKADVQLTPTETEEALELLRDPRLLERILEDFRSCGVVGEETNKLLGYLAAVSRKLDTPLAVVIQSSSAAGKSSLMEAMLAFIPEEDRVKYSAMTGQSLFYMGGADLQHKVLAIVEEEGAERASYALKLLQSEGELTIASTGKDPATGRHVTHEYHVEGPVMIFLTTTAVEIDEELLNRCVVLTVNEDREQTRLIHQMQRERQTLRGQLARRDTSRILRRHQNAQRLLRPLVVANEYAPQLTFRDDQTRTRRDHNKYLTLIRTIALQFQHQRPLQTSTEEGKEIPYITVTRDDIRIANRLANEILGRTLDELPPQTRRLLEQLYGWVTSECARLQMTPADFRFQRADVRALGWGVTQAREHLDKLVDFEYVVVHRGTRGQTFVYELVYNGQGQDGQRFLMGLIDPDALPAECVYDGKLAGSTPELAEGWRPQGGPKTPGWRGDADGPNAASDTDFSDKLAAAAENTVPVAESGPALSYPQGATGGPRRLNGSGRA